MKKRAAALALCALLVFQLTVPPAKAAEDLYFIAAQEYILPLSDSTMPFWYNGYLYIPSTIFTGVVRETLDISHTYNSAEKHVILYGGLRSSGRSIWFELDKGYGYDKDGNTFNPGAILRGGVPYVPASVVAKFFGLEYSLTDAAYGHLIWLRPSSFGLTPEEFTNASTYSVARRYNEYLKSKAAAAPSDTPENGGQGVEIEGRSIYLCLEAGDSAPALLDALDRYGAQAAFFCTADFMRENGGLLRRMAATGQAVGILADGSDPDRTVTEQLEAGNRALALATCGKTRLALVQNGSDQALQAARDAGYCCVTPDIDRTDYELQSGSNASSLLKRISTFRGDVSIWLGGTADATGLRAFLSAAENADGSCLALTETA